MRTLALVSILIWAAPASAQQPPSFEFRGYAAGSEASAEQTKGCTEDGPDVLSCVDGFVPVGGASSFVMATLYKSRLSRLYVSSKQGNWPAIEQAFTAKYGKPCRQEVEDWQSAGGVKLKNIVEHWCFATGELSLRQYGGKLTETLAVYVDENKAPPKPAKVDF